MSSFSAMATQTRLQTRSPYDTLSFLSTFILFILGAHNASIFLAKIAQRFSGALLPASNTKVFRTCGKYLVEASNFCFRPEMVSKETLCCCGGADQQGSRKSDLNYDK